MASIHRLNRTSQAVSRLYDRVVVDQGFVPTDIAGLRAWYDFSDASTLFTDAGVTNVSADSDLIYQINDKSGLNRTALQANAVNRPTYKTNIQNGLSASLWSFAQVLILQSGMDMLKNVSGATLISVVVPTSAMGDNQIFMVLTGAWQGRAVIQANANNLAMGGRRLDTDGFVRVSAPANYTNNNPYIVTGLFEYSDSTAYLYVNGSEVASNTSFQTDGNTSNTDSTNITIGDNPSLSQGWRGYIAEIIVYGVSLGAYNLSAIHAYLNNKWSIY